MCLYFCYTISLMIFLGYALTQFLLEFPIHFFNDLFSFLHNNLDFKLHYFQ